MKGTGFSLWDLSVLASAPAWGRMNECKTAPPKRIQPTIEADEYFDLVLRGRKDWILREGVRRSMAKAKGASFKVKSDYAVALVHLGRAQEALSTKPPIVAAPERAAKARR